MGGRPALRTRTAPSQRRKLPWNQLAEKQRNGFAECEWSRSLSSRDCERYSKGRVGPGVADGERACSNRTVWAGWAALRIARAKRIRASSLPA